MLPAMIPFVIASLVCICFITIYPIGIAFLQPAFVRSHNMCTDFSYSYYGGFQSKECVSTKRDHFIDTDTSGAMLGVWIVGCAISCKLRCNHFPNINMSVINHFVFINVCRCHHVLDHRPILSVQVCGGRIQTKSFASTNQ